jgi:acetyl/propionyl-CoA carboxylase alpha subunit
LSAHGFTKVLVANRGEIACRIIRTCRAEGYFTVAVYSDADVGAPHVEAADEAVHIGSAPAADSYLAVDRILEAAGRTGAGAIHPGYGFLAENADFARAVEAAGLVFIGPTPDTLDRCGSKRAARALMEGAGVPVVPGYNGEDAARFEAEAARIGFPVLVKASAGGGGKGMTVVRRAEDLEAALSSARRIGEASFGDGALLLERYVERPRHIEVQIVGDGRGEVLHLLERECSVQRRFQKIIEETPSPALDAELRGRLCAAAVQAGQALDYRGAGTVEFILAPDGAFYFLEVNARLQVEHPVTECVTGLDIVALQLRVAAGEGLGITQDDVAAHGHSTECRLYAEDPANDFLPATGTVVDWAVPEGIEGLRVDTGVREGSEVGVYYDPMLAKVITHGANRADSTRKMRAALRRLGVAGVVTNRDFLLQVLTHEAYGAGALHTGFIEEHFASAGAGSSTDEASRAAIAWTVFSAASRHADHAVLPSIRPGWRNSAFRPQRVEVNGPDGEPLVVEYTSRTATEYRVRIVRDTDQYWSVAQLDALGSRSATLTVDGHRTRWRFRVDGAFVYARSPDCAAALERVEDFPDVGGEEVAGGCVAPMPGKVVRVLVEAGQLVERGAPLIILEAMKMEHTLAAPDDGTVESVRCADGDLVDAGVVLVTLSEAGDGSEAAES